jgi:hypothetical protein
VVLQSARTGASSEDSTSPAQRALIGTARTAGRSADRMHNSHSPASARRAAAQASVRAPRYVTTSASAISAGVTLNMAPPDGLDHGPLDGLDHGPPDGPIMAPRMARSWPFMAFLASRRDHVVPPGSGGPPTRYSSRPTARWATQPLPRDPPSDRRASGTHGGGRFHQRSEAGIFGAPTRAVDHGNMTRRAGTANRRMWARSARARARLRRDTAIGRNLTIPKTITIPRFDVRFAVVSGR